MSQMVSKFETTVHHSFSNPGLTLPAFVHTSIDPRFKLLSSLGVHVWPVLCVSQIARSYPQVKPSHVASLAASMATGEQVVSVVNQLGLGPLLLFKTAPGLRTPSAKMLKVG